MISKRVKGDLFAVFWIAVVILLLMLTAILNRQKQPPEPNCDGWSKARWEAGDAPRGCYK